MQLPPRAVPRLEGLETQGGGEKIHEGEDSLCTFVSLFSQRFFHDAANVARAHFYLTLS